MKLNKLRNFVFLIISFINHNKQLFHTDNFVFFKYVVWWKCTDCVWSWSSWFCFDLILIRRLRVLDLKISRHLRRRRVGIETDCIRSFFWATLYCACVFRISNKPTGTTRMSAKQAPTWLKFCFSDTVERDIFLQILYFDAKTATLWNAKKYTMV